MEYAGLEILYQGPGNSQRSLPQMLINDILGKLAVFCVAICKVGESGGDERLFGICDSRCVFEDATKLPNNDLLGDQQLRGPSRL